MPVAELLVHASVVVAALAAVVLAAGVVRTAGERGWRAAAVLASALGLTLEFLLAAGLLRLSTLGLPGLGVVAVVVLVRQVIARGLRYARLAVAG